MASKFATELIRTVLDAKDVLVEDTLDAELQEVREVLEGLATKRYASFTGQYCWCDVPGTATRPEGDTHTEKCQRARQLAERLRVG